MQHDSESDGGDVYRLGTFLRTLLVVYKVCEIIMTLLDSTIRTTVKLCNGREPENQFYRIILGRVQIKPGTQEIFQ